MNRVLSCCVMTLVCLTLLVSTAYCAKITEIGDLDLKYTGKTLLLNKVDIRRKSLFVVYGTEDKIGWQFNIKVDDISSFKVGDLVRIEKDRQLSQIPKIPKAPPANTQRVATVTELFGFSEALLGKPLKVNSTEPQYKKIFLTFQLGNRGGSLTVFVDKLPDLKKGDTLIILGDMGLFKAQHGFKPESPARKPGAAAMVTGFFNASERGRPLAIQEVKAAAGTVTIEEEDGSAYYPDIKVDDCSNLKTGDRIRVEKDGSIIKLPPIEPPANFAAKIMTAQFKYKEYLGKPLTIARIDPQKSIIAFEYEYKKGGSKGMTVKVDDVSNLKVGHQVRIEEYWLVITSSELKLPTRPGQKPIPSKSVSPKVSPASVLDQSNDIDEGRGCNIVPANKVSQTVVPTLGCLTAVAVALKTSNKGRGGDQITLTILGQSGEQLSSAKKKINEGFDGYLRFELPEEGISVTPGQPITIMVQDSGKNVFSWKFKGGNPYTAGQSYFYGKPFGDKDFSFKTYGKNSCL